MSKKLKAKSIETFVNPLTIKIFLEDGRELRMYPQDEMAKFEPFFELAEDLRKTFGAPVPKQSAISKKAEKLRKKLGQ